MFDFYFSQTSVHYTYYYKKLNRTVDFVEYITDDHSQLILFSVVTYLIVLQTNTNRK